MNMDVRSATPAAMIPLFWILHFSSVYGADFSSRIQRQTVPAAIGPIVTMAGGGMMFNCSSRGRNGNVSWFRPKDNLQVSYNTQVLPQLQERIRVIHNPQTGDYNLVLRYAQFPQDNGTWWCDVFGGPRIAYNLLVMVPPTSRLPQINPLNGIIFQVTSEAWTFTCVAHHAYPPVVLRWVKKSGPNADFGALPLSVTVAPDGTIATSSRLVLSHLNHGSEFSCLADHATFMGKTFSTDLQFVLADTKAASAGMTSMSGIPQITRDASVGNVALVIMSVTVVVLVMIIAATLFIRRKDWHLDVRSSPSWYSAVPMSDTSESTTEKSNSNGLLSGKSFDVIQIDKREHRRCLTKILIGGVLLFLLLIIVCFIIPVYIKGFPVPVRGVDEIVAVMAGSMLWMDCSSLASVSDNLLMVNYRKHKDMFYSQLNNPTLSALGRIGFPANNTMGRSLGVRAQTHQLGQLSIWPVLPGDEGLYICEAGRILDDSGRTVFQRKFFAVTVITGAPINVGLIALAVLGIITVICLVIFGAYHSIKCTSQLSSSGSSQGSTPTKEDVTKVEEGREEEATRAQDEEGLVENET